MVSFGQFNYDGTTITCAGMTANSTTTLDIDGTDRVVTAVDNTSIAAKPIGDADWDCICTTLVTDTSNLFNNKRTFNQDLSRWDTSNVTNMQSMFSDARAFNQDISEWDVSSVTNMKSMFNKAHQFNKNISSWDVSSVITMELMFSNADRFNNGDATNAASNPLTWNTQSVTNMRGMFFSGVFNQDIGSWNVSNVENMSLMFKFTKKFGNGGQPMNWTTSSLENMAQMFRNTDAFNQDISGWDVSSVTNMAELFKQNDGFNNNGQPLNWNTSSVKNMTALFYLAKNFNQDISGWDTSNVTQMQNMFREAVDFDQDISGWNTSSVNNMSNMFKFATSFNQEIGGWDVRSVTNMTGMFENATLFNGNLSSWCVSHNPSHGSFATGSGLIAANFPGWGLSCVPTVILTDTDGDNLLGSGAIVTITATFDQDMANSPQYSINSGASYFDLTAGGNALTWTHQLIANNLSDGAYTFLVSGTSVGGVSYDLSQGTQDGDETEVDKITFTVDRTPPTVVLSDDDVDNLLSASDMVVVTANFSEAMNANPTLSMSGGLISGANMIATGDPSTWTYTINVSSLGASDGDYQVSVSGTDLAGNAYTGSEIITFTIDVTPPTVILTDTDSDDIVFPDTTMTVTANFSEAMQQTPTISLGSVFVDAQMSPTGSPQEWTYFIDFSTLTITPGNHAITVGGRDIAGNPYAGSENIVIEYQRFIPTITASDVTRMYVDSTDPQFTLGISSTSTGTLAFEKLVSGCSYISVTPAGEVTINGAGTCRIKVSQAANSSFQSGVAYFDLIINKATPSINPPNLARTCGISEFPLTADCPTTPKQMDLVGLYDFNGDLNDGTGNGYNGIIAGDPSLDEDRFGNPSSAYTFDGDDEIYFGNAMADEWAGSPDHFTISFWAKSNLSCCRQDIASLGQYECNSSGRGSVIRLGHPSAGGDFSGCNEGWPGVNIGSAATGGDWHHYIFVNDSRGRTVYVDGVKKDNKPGTNLFSIKTYGLTIGGGYQNTGGIGAFNGSVDDVALWKTGLTDEEVAAFYANQKSECENTGGSFTYTSLDPSIVSITGGDTASIKGSGVATIEATLVEDANYNSATATFTITVSKGNSTPTISDELRNYGDADFTLTTSTTSTGNIVYTVSDTSVATVSGSTVHIEGAGSTTIFVTVLGDACYNAATTSMTLTVNSVSQTVTWPSPITKIFENPPSPFPLDVPSTNEGYTGTITYSSSDTSIASVDPVTGEVTINNVGSGSVILTAHLASDGNYDSTTVTT
ncbi:MAG: hypothetical protein CMC44_04825, partial [Flavobacteriaceae bacterium]|nr:hypothetical protein [Flavobacteriaceae bacterium]